MAVNPMMNAGVSGIQNGYRGLRQAAQDVAELNLEREADASDKRAEPSRDVQDAAQAITDLKLYERQVQASAKVVQTADAVLGMLLDTEA
jgi:flagellar hook protein FlgE